MAWGETVSAGLSTVKRGREGGRARVASSLSRTPDLSLQAAPDPLTHPSPEVRHPLLARPGRVPPQHRLAPGIEAGIAGELHFRIACRCDAFERLVEITRLELTKRRVLFQAADERPR